MTTLDGFIIALVATLVASVAGADLPWWWRFVLRPVLTAAVVAAARVWLPWS